MNKALLLLLVSELFCKVRQSVVSQAARTVVILIEG